jgi:hypothetical protein
MVDRKIGVRLAHWFFAALVGIGTLGIAAASAQTAPRSVEGQLSVVWGDPRPGFGKVSGEQLRFHLTLRDGTTIPLDVAAYDRPSAIRAFGQHVRIEGRDPTAPSGAIRTAPMLVDKLTVADTAQTQAVAPATVTKRVLFVLLKYSDDLQTPHAPAFYTALTNPLLPDTTLHIPATINGYFYNTSWNQLSWTADVVGATGLNSTSWLTLPRPKSAYANCGWTGACANVNLIANDAMTMVSALGINPTVYSNINFVINNDLDCCAWGGSFVYQNRHYGATWEPPWGQETGVYVHEMGHSLGLPHSGWKYFAYDSPWDDMSRGIAAQRVQCGSYRSANSSGGQNALYCTEPGGGYISAHKDALSWIPAANKVVVNSISTQTVTLEANSAPLGAAAKMIKICLPGLSCTGSTAHFLTVEARMKTAQYERGVPGEGVMIHDVVMNRGAVGSGNPCFFNTQSGWAMPFDATDGDYRAAPYCDSGGRAYPNYALFNAQYGVGGSVASALYGVQIDVLSKTSSTFSVRVTRTK